jgi:DNA-binding NtrC family response regulator
VAAAARDLRQDVLAGTFREDLFYRLNVVRVKLPPLRERREDIPLLLTHFLHRLGPALHAQTRAFDSEALRLLDAYAWPGNVRELRNLVERMLVLHGREPVVTAARLPEEFHADTAGESEPSMESMPAAPPEASAVVGAVPLEEAVMAYEKRLIAEALRVSGGVQTRAATRLGTTRRILRYKMEKLGLAGEAAGLTFSDFR